MTTFVSEEKKCAICGKTSKHNVITSTSTLGAPDLDTRPAELKRSTINMWIQTCPSCGYSGADISKEVEKASEIVQSDFYQKQLNDPEFPKLANAFLCHSVIQESAGNYTSAGWANVYAAWVCDDAGSGDSAQKCRQKAVTFFQKARENSQQFAKGNGAEEAVMVDLLRRLGQFELAIKICDDGLKKNPEKLISDILQFQKILISKSDVACHTVTEITGDNKQ